MKYWKAVRKTATKNVFQTGGIGGSTETDFEVGKTYEIKESPKLCGNGFHFYKSKDFIFGIDLFGEDSTFFVEIEPLSTIISDTEKCVCTKIKILRYVPIKEWHKLLDNKSNSGDYNSGDYNSGDYNSGYRNSGDRNSGYRNSGYRNSGNHNSGNHNSGYRNSGDRNSGDCNSGDCNSGNHNSGDYNSGDGYRNYFCTQTKYFLFDIEVEKETIDKTAKIDISWFTLENKTYKQAWDSCPNEVLDQFRNIPEFQTKKAKEKFLKITGLIL